MFENNILFFRNRQSIVTPAQKNVKQSVVIPLLGEIFACMRSSGLIPQQGGSCDHGGDINHIQGVQVDVDDHVICFAAVNPGTLHIPAESGKIDEGFFQTGFLPHDANFQPVDFLDFFAVPDGSGAVFAAERRG